MFRRFRWLIVLVCVLAILVVLHRPILRGMAARLISDDPPESPTHLCLLGSEYGPRGDRALDAVSEALKEDPQRGVLLIAAPPCRLVQYEVLRPFDKLVADELRHRGAKPASLEKLATAGDEREVAAALIDWLQEHKDARVEILCDRFNSGAMSQAFEPLVDPATRARVGIRALADRRFDESDWWQRRQGVLAVMYAWLNRILGGNAGPSLEWDPDAYERDLKADAQME